MHWLERTKIFVGLTEKAASIGLSLYRNVDEELQQLIIEYQSGDHNSLLTNVDERCFIKDDLAKTWVRKLQSVMFDTEDLIDEYQSSAKLPSRKRKWRQNVASSIVPECILQKWRLAAEIDKIVKRREEILKELRDLRLKGEDEAGREPFGLSSLPSETIPVHDPAKIFGRENDKNEIMELLRPAEASTSASRPRITVVPIYGVAGIGKTTLAQFVYNDTSLNSCFDIKAWVWWNERCDSSNDTKRINAMKKIYEKITGERSNLGDFNILRESLRNYLTTRPDNKFLLVIDDLLETDFYFLKMLLEPLLDGGEGSKVLITTCSEITWEIPGLIHRPSLTGLEVEDCWHLIQSLAFRKGNNFHVDLVTTGEEIARRCYGSPMAAKALGALLYRRSAEEWFNVLSDFKDNSNEAVITSLNVNYHHLPYSLKQCFRYCSVFPEGYAFQRDEVISHWVSLKLIQPDRECQPEEIGMRYFNELLWRSFFEKMPSEKDRVEQYRIPNLMHKIAIEVSKYDTRILRFKKSQAVDQPHLDQPQVRYASLILLSDERTLNLNCIEPYSNLRTLKFSHGHSDGVAPLNSIPAPCFRKFMHLRVLDMNNTDLEEVPDSVAELIYLRFLDLSNTKIKTLPDKICDLVNLQILKLKGCLQLECLPEGLPRLTNLRHLDLHLDWEEITDSTNVAIPQNIGGLESLQTLSRFNVASAEAQHCNISELKDLNLQGDLCILNLEKVPTGEAKNANLKGKHFIEKLMLRWHSSALNNELLRQQSEEIINSLEPDIRLRCLWIVNYPGTKFPDWIADASFSRIETIRISNCKISNLLSLLQHLPWLMNLRIENAHGDTMSMPEGFPSLEDLTFLNLNSLRRLTLGNEMPKLKKLYVSDCSELQDLVIHRNLYDKFERGNLPSSLRIICVPQE